MVGRWAPDPWGEEELRWHDGTQWTSHVARARAGSRPEQPASDLVVARRDPDRSRATPLWAKVAVPAVALLGIGAAASAIGNSNDRTDTSSDRPSASTVATAATAPPAITTTTVAVPVAVAVETTAPPEVASEAAVPAADPVLVQTCVDFTQAAATMSMQKYVDLWNFVHNDPATLAAACGMMAEPDLVLISQDMQAVQALFDASVTTAPPPPPDTTAPAPAAPPPATAAPVPFVSLPPSTQPPPVVTSPPASSCDPNYSGCVPIASDVDCAGGSGNGPAYARGPITVIGVDIYDLDRDGDGVACD